MSQKMSKRRVRLAERNDAIRAEFEKQWAKGYRTDYIVKELESAYHLHPLTLEDIVFRKGVYQDF